jgi:hypothetical protein
MHHYIRPHHKKPRRVRSVSSRLSASGLNSLISRKKRRERGKNKKGKKCKSTRKQVPTKKKKKTGSSRRGRSDNNTPVASVEPPRHAPNPFLSPTLEIPLGVEVLVVHVALEVRGRAAVVGKQLLDVQELAGRGLVADGLAVFVGLALFRHIVGQGFGGGGVHVRAACFGAPDGSISRSREADGRSLGYGGCGGDRDDDERG